MNTRTMLTAALLASLAAAAAGQSTPTSTQPKQDKQTQPLPAHTTGTVNQTSQNNQPNQNASKNPFAQANQPGREQLDLVRFTVGEWNAAVTMWNEPNAQPISSTGKAKFYSTMGGRFVATDFECQFNGAPMKGMGLYGYNNGEKRYESTWIDNQTSAIFFFTGVRQDKTITWNTTFTDPTNGAKKNIKSIEVFGENTINYTMFEIASNGTEFKKLEINYTRTGRGGPMETTPIETRSDGKSTTSTPNNTGTPNTGNKPHSPVNNSPKHD